MKAPSKKKYPNCNTGHQYALDVVDEKIPACSFVFAACERYLDDIQRDCFELRWDLAERFLRMFQCFEHVIGEWKTPNILLEPWQKFFFMNVELFYWKRTGKRRFKAAHLEVPRGSGKALCLETPVPTPSGMARFGDLEVGDTILSRGKKPCKIIGQTKVHFPQQWKMKFSNGKTVLASSYHLWFARINGEDERIRGTDEIEEFVGKGGRVFIDSPLGEIEIMSVDEIASRDAVPMKCIEVDSVDSSFLITSKMIPTHNSAMASVTGLIYLNLVETVKGNKVYSCATKKDQARIVLDSARKMASGNKQYLRGTGTEVFAHHIAHEKTGSEFRALSSDANSLDGLQPVLAIVDELHAHKTRDLYDVVDSAMSKRRDSFLLVITTAGNDITGIGFSQSEYAKKVALGDLDDDSFMSLVYTLDKEDDWMDPLSWEKANPNWGVSVDEDAFKSKAMKAINNPADMINFKIKHLNLWQNTLSRFFSVDKWDELGNKLLSFADMRGQKCYIGVDLATKVDMVAIAYVFKNKETGKFKIFVDSFCPEDTVRESKNNMYPVWVESGELIATPGAAVGLSALREGFVKKARTVKASSVHYDPWNATEFGQELARNRFDAVEFKMSVGNLSEPMKKLEELIRDGMIEHDGSSLLSWCLGNVVAKYDANDNVFPRKNHESMKIDQIVAILMALAGWVAEEENESVYATRGIRVL